MKPRILLGLTTTKGSDWKGKVKEIDRLDLKEIAIFPTCLKIDQRKALYQALEKTKLEKIPFVHLKDDFKAWELDYLITRFGTKVFNAHFDRINEESLAEFRKHLDKIYLENHKHTPDSLVYLLDTFAGICLDLSHWEDYGHLQKMPNYKKFPALLKKYKIGCCHISAIAKEAIYDEGEDGYNRARHKLENLSELNYVKKYIKYLPTYSAIELENSFQEQLEEKKYLEEMINKKISKF